MSRDLTPDKALIFRITHRNNVGWLIENGLHCSNSNVHDPKFVPIGNPDLIKSRATRQVPRSPHGPLGDYVPFYFTPYTPMMLNIKTGRGGMPRRDLREVVIIVSALPTLAKHGVPFLFTDRHAYLAAARFFSDLDDLDQIDWPRLQARDFRKNLDNLEPFERYQADLPTKAMRGIVCYDDSTATSVSAVVAKAKLQVPVHAKPGLYV